VTAAPDFAEPFQAWRVWKVIRRGRDYDLGSVVKKTLWPVGEPLLASCLAKVVRIPFRRRIPHGAPDSGCQCGIYAADLDRIGDYVAEPSFRGVSHVLGRVALWGTVIECERGFRASHAYPLEIYVPADAGEPWRTGWDEIAFGLARYGVPIEPLATRAHEAPGYLASRIAA
jgi:hypothetical protein